MNSRIELCCQCNDPTGRAGRHDDSLYLAEGTPAELGPLCVTCHNTLSNADRIAELERENAELRALISESRAVAAGYCDYLREISRGDMRIRQELQPQADAIAALLARIDGATRGLR